jgi:hypothetical protein
VLTCREVSEKASRLLDDDLGPVERMALRAHLAACAHCARYVDQLARTVSALPEAASAPPDAETEARIMAALAAAAPRTAPQSVTAPNMRTGFDALLHAFMIGLAGLLIWEVFARGIAPFWIGFALDPTTLINAALDVHGAGAVAIHLCVGTLLFPIGFLLVVRPLARTLAPRLPWWGVGTLYGTVLWVLAGTLVANWMGGMEAFFGFGAVAWASLVGHAALGVSMAGAERYRGAAVA